MLSLGGVIGTGLFLSSGYTIQQAGPAGTILAYLVGAGIVYLVMLCLGELSVAMPVTGAFHTYAQIHRAGHRIYGCLAVLADMDRGIGIRIHSDRPVNAALVPPYIGLDVECRLCAVHFLA